MEKIDKDSSPSAPEFSDLVKSVALDESMKNAQRGSDEPIWNVDLDRMKSQYADNPDVQSLIEKVEALRVAKTGSRSSI